jgi:DNA-binding NarL/FixJ family response regulator
MHKTTTIKIVIADDHPFFRDGIRFLVQKMEQKEIEIAGEAENGVELLKIVDELRPDVIITDLNMPVMDGIEATRQILSKYPDAKIIAISMYDEESMIIDMLIAGAKGYLLKNEGKDEIISAIKAVHCGGNYFSNNTSKKLFTFLANSKYNPFEINHINFSDQELNIIKLICKQLTTKEISKSLNLGIRTIDDYRNKIQAKTGAKNAVGIALYAVKNSLVALEEI